MSKGMPKPATHTYLVGDLKCYFCGTICGWVGRECQSAPGSVWFWKRRDEQQPVPAPDRLQVRCARCGGPTYVDDLRTITRRREQQTVPELRSRPGRPPTRRKKQRARNREDVKRPTA